MSEKATIRRENAAVRAGALAHPEHELRDLCSSALWDRLPAEAFEESPSFNKARTALEGASIVGGGKVLKKIPGMGTVYDWRTSPWTPSNGGRIKPLVFVQHIPVVPNAAGISDFVRLRDVLVAQGLMVQNATDRDGNVALFTPMDALCYQARGANQLSVGTEHMHLTVNEEWTKRQMRASAWLINQAKDKYDIDAHRGKLGAGSGLVHVVKRGQTSHEEVSNKAGFHDRIDPGDKYDWEYVYKCVVEYRARVKDGTADKKGFEGI